MTWWIFGIFSVIRNALPSKITVLKPDISKIPYIQNEEPVQSTSVGPFSSFLTSCFKSIIALAAIYVSIDFGCWNKTYLEPIENDYDKPEAAEDSVPSEWERLANYIAGRAWYACYHLLVFCDVEFIFVVSISSGITHVSFYHIVNQWL